MRHHQKIAIARLISDLIKSDDVICREEIALYNRIVNNFSISPDELYEAQFISQAEAMHYIAKMPTDEQKRIFTILHKAAYSDNLCVSKEALLLLTLKLILHDKEDKYHIFSTKSNNLQNNEKYIVYIESDYMHAINDEIVQQYDAISNLVHLWKFEFIYIPKICQSCCEMDREFLVGIIRYMNPRLSAEMVENLYERLTHFNTETYTRDYLANASHNDYFLDIPPSLLISVGQSYVPRNALSPNDTCFANYITIRLDDETNAVYNEIRRFIDEYESFISEPEYYTPLRSKSMFKYHGFYKELFDFLARPQTNGEENNIFIDLPAHRIWMRGIEIPMSGTLLATYIFILYQSFCTHYGGLIKAGQHHPLSSKEVDQLGRTYRTICKLFRGEIVAERSYLDDVPNIRGYIARIRTNLAHHIDATDLDFYYPKDSADKSMYRVSIDPEKVKIRDTQGEYAFVDYPTWKIIK